MDRSRYLFPNQKTDGNRDTTVYDSQCKRADLKDNMAMDTGVKPCPTHIRIIMDAW